MKGIVMTLQRLVFFSFILFLMMLALSPGISTWAQATSQTGPVYVVQEGDSLWSIAKRFRVGVDALAELNNITNPNQLIVGAQLVIPGLEGIEGVLTTIDIPYGQTVRSLSRHYQINFSDIARLNHFVNPMELYAGSTLVIPKSADIEMENRWITLEKGQFLLEMAALGNLNPRKIMLDNNFDYHWQLVPADPLMFPGDGVSGLGGFPDIIRDVTITPIVSLQGKTTVINIFTDEDLNISGSLLGHKISFFPLEKGHYVALQGIHAMTNAGIYPLRLDIERTEKQTFAYSQMINVQVVDYPYDRPLTVDVETIDPIITKPEDEKWFDLVSGNWGAFMVGVV
jgi:LysM repeat protein